MRKTSYRLTKRKNVLCANNFFSKTLVLPCVTCLTNEDIIWNCVIIRKTFT